MNAPVLTIPPSAVLTRAVSPLSLRRDVRAGRLQRVSQGVYLPTPVVWRDTLVVALALAGPGAVVSHSTAARLHGWTSGLPEGRLHLTRFDGPDDPWSRSEILLTRSTLLEHERGTCRGLPCTSPGRTVFDTLRTLDEADAVRWFEVTQALLPPGTTDEVRTRRGRHSSLVRRRMAAADPRSGSWLETAFRLLLARNGIEMPTSQVELRRAGRLLARVDFAWRHLRLVVELEGKEFHTGETYVRKDRLRQNDVAALGWRVLRFTYADVVHHPDRVVQQIRLALAEAAATAA